MADLRVRLGDLELRSPVLCGSGEHVMTRQAILAALQAGAAAVVAKSANESEAARRQLASAEYLWLDGHFSGSLLNRSGLVDRPFERWLETLAGCDAAARTHGAYVAASLIPGDPDVLAELAAQVEQAGLRWLELNLGAPHAGEAAPGAIERPSEAERVRQLTAAVRARVSLHLTVKLTAESADLVALAAAAREAGADSVTLMGRHLGFLPELRTRRPLLGTFGGYGGPWALPLACRWIAKTRLAKGSELPLVGSGGARGGEDVARFLLAGASAVQLASAVYLDGPAALSRVTAELERYLDDQGLDARDLVGQAADAVLTYEQAARSRA